MLSCLGFAVSRWSRKEEGVSSQLKQMKHLISSLLPAGPTCSSCRPFSLPQGQQHPQQVPSSGNVLTFLSLFPGLPPTSFPFLLGLSPLLFLYRNFNGISRCSKDVGCKLLCQIQPTVMFPLAQGVGASGMANL